MINDFIKRPAAGSRYLDERIECMPRPELEALQTARLRVALKSAFEQAPLVRETWGQADVSPQEIRTLDDFRAAAPFVDKESIRRYRDHYNDPSGGLSGAQPPRLKGLGFTSGTTGDPTPVPRGARPPHDVAGQRDIWEMGARPGDYVSRVMFTFRYGQSLNRFLQLGMKPIPFEFNPRELPRLIEASLRFRPTYLGNLSNGLITALEQVLDRQKVDPLDVFASYRGALFGGEPMGGRQRRLVRDWGLDIFDNTSLGDVVGATDCREHRGFHSWEDFALVEAIDPEGTKEVADGEIGELVVTSLTDDVTALVRYRTDDLVVLDRSGCGCGRTHMRVKLLGRKGDQVLVGGRSVLPLDVWPLVEGEPESAAALFQLVRPQREVEVLHVRVGYNAKSGSSLESLKRRLHAKFDEHLAVKVHIELVEDAVLLRQGPPHKIPRVTKK